MNTHATDRRPLEINNVESYRLRLIASRMPKDRIYYGHEAPASLWECLGWTAFAMAALAGLAEAIMWGLR